MADRAEMLQRADEVALALAGRSAEIEVLRRLPDDIAARLADSGMLRLLLPAAHGGDEADVGSFFLAVERLARADAAAGWCTMIGCTATLVTAYLPAAAAASLIRSPRLRMAGVFAPRGRALPAERDGIAGFLVSGRWAWGSFAHHAEWMTLGCLELDSGGEPLPDAAGAPRTLSALVPRAAIHTLDNWASLGLRGTGSGEIEVHEAFIPTGQVVRLAVDRPLPRPLYRFPIFGLLAVGISAVSSGVARRALDEFMILATHKTPQGSRRLLAERATVQEAVARAEAQWRAARAFLLEATAAAWTAAVEQGGISIELRRDLRLACTHTAHGAAAVAERLFTLAGGDAVFDTSALQRAWRDAHTATQHLMVGEPTWELSGRLGLGQPADTGML